MKKAIFPGSFDPITLGHIDIITRAASLFDEVVVVILENSSKKCLFTIEERMAFLHKSTQHLRNVHCKSDDGLCIDFARKEKANAIIRGIRNANDYEYERDIAHLNQHLDASIQTVLLSCDPKYSYVSSSMIREMIKYHQDVSAFLSEDVANALAKKQ